MIKEVNEKPPMQCTIDEKCLEIENSYCFIKGTLGNMSNMSKYNNQSKLGSALDTFERIFRRRSDSPN